MAEMKKGDEVKLDDDSDMTPLNNNRTKTDTLSLLGFSTTLLFYTGIAIYAFRNGDVTNTNTDIQAITYLDENATIIYNFIQEIINLRFVIFSCFVFAGMLSVLYIGILMWIPGFFISTAIAVECLVLIYYIISSPMLVLIGLRPFYLSSFLCAIFFIFCTITKLRIVKKVGSKTISEVIKESCRAVLKFPSSIFVSIIILVFEIITVFFALYVFSHLMSIKSPAYRTHMIPTDECVCPDNLMYYDGNSCDVEIFNEMCKSINNSSCSLSSCIVSYYYTPIHIYFLHAVNVIVALWICGFIYYFGHMVLSGTFARWYWTKNKRSIPYTTVLKSTYTTIRYHLGSIAYGTSPWAFITIIWVMITCIGNRLDEFFKQPFTMLLIWWSIFAKIVDNGLTACSIHGNEFKQSTKSACNISMRNSSHFFIMNKAIEWLTIFMMLFVSVITLWASWSYLANQYYYYAPIRESLIIILIAVVTITLPILALLSVAINTILFCIFEDVENNESSKNKNYFMSYNLQTLFVLQ